MPNLPKRHAFVCKWLDRGLSLASVALLLGTRASSPRSVMRGSVMKGPWSAETHIDRRD
jgi:hypothetical protein